MLRLLLLGLRLTSVVHLPRELAATAIDTSTLARRNLWNAIDPNTVVLHGEVAGARDKLITLSVDLPCPGIHIHIVDNFGWLDLHPNRSIPIVVTNTGVPQPSRMEQIDEPIIRYDYPVQIFGADQHGLLVGDIHTDDDGLIVSMTLGDTTGDFRDHFVNSNGTLPDGSSVARPTPSGFNATYAVDREFVVEPAPECPIIVSDRLQLGKDCIGHVDHWRIMVFYVLDCSWCSQPGFLLLRAIFRHNLFACYVSVYLTFGSPGADATGGHSVYMVPECIGHDYHWNHTIDHLQVDWTRPADLVQL